MATRLKVDELSKVLIVLNHNKLLSIDNVPQLLM